MYLGMSPPVGAYLSDVEEGGVKALGWRWTDFGVLNPRLAVVLLCPPSPEQGGMVGRWICAPTRQGHHAVTGLRQSHPPQPGPLQNNGKKNKSLKPNK